MFYTKPTRMDHFEQVSDHCIIPGKEVAIASAMWQWGEAWELAHRSLTLLTHYHAVVHLCTPTTNAQNKKRITFRLSFLAVRRGLELRSSRADTL